MTQRITNLVNKNMTTVKIAEADLGKIADGCGVEEDFDDTGVLHGIEIAIKVVLVPASAQWPAKNDIKDYKGADEVDIDADDENDSPFAGFGEDTGGETEDALEEADSAPVEAANDPDFETTAE